MRSVPTDLIVKEGIMDVSGNFGHSLNVVLGFLVALGVDAIV